jgi:uncharacterized protein YkwD
VLKAGPSGADEQGRTMLLFPRPLFPRPLLPRPHRVSPPLAAARALLLVSGVLTAACSSMVSSPTPVATDADQAYCVDEINRLRGTVGLQPLHRAGDLESYATAAAANDTKARVAHQYFYNTNGAGVARGETQILWWSGYPVQTVIRQGLAEMWKQGAGGTHYQILTGGYGEVGCGVFVNGPEVSVGQAFR